MERRLVIIGPDWETEFLLADEHMQKVGDNLVSFVYIPFPSNSAKVPCTLVRINDVSQARYGVNFYVEPNNEDS